MKDLAKGFPEGRPFFYEKLRGAEKDDDSEQADHRLEHGLSQEMGGGGGGDEGQREKQIDRSDDFQGPRAHDPGRHSGNRTFSC